MESQNSCEDDLDGMPPEFFEGLESHVHDRIEVAENGGDVVEILAYTALAEKLSDYSRPAIWEI